MKMILNKDISVTKGQRCLKCSGIFLKIYLEEMCLSYFIYILVIILCYVENNLKI